MKNEISVLLVEPGKVPRMITIGADLKSMQDIVGGYIEAIYPFDDDVALVCNEEGKLLGLPLNRDLRDEYGGVTDIIAGMFFICGVNENSFTSLPRDLESKYKSEFYVPVKFIRQGTHIRIEDYPSKSLPKI